MFALQNWQILGENVCIREAKSWTLRKECDKLPFVCGHAYIEMGHLLTDTASITKNDKKMDTLITCLRKQSSQAL